MRGTNWWSTPSASTTRPSWTITARRRALPDDRWRQDAAGGRHRRRPRRLHHAVDRDPALAARLGSPDHRDDLRREQLQLLQLCRGADPAGRQGGFLRGPLLAGKRLAILELCLDQAPGAAGRTAA